MSLVTELDALTAKLQARVDAAFAEAWQGLQGMASDVEQEWQEMRQECCPPAGEDAGTAAEGEPSHAETSTEGAGDQPMA